MAAEDDLLAAVAEMRRLKDEIVGYQTELADLNARRTFLQSEVTRLQALFITKRGEAKTAAGQI